jgi:hypothetical protein
MPDEDRGEGEQGQRAWRVFCTTLLALLAVLFGGMGACGITFTVSATHAKPPEPHDLNAAPLVLTVAIPFAVVGIVGFVGCVRTLYRTFRRRSA